MTAIPDIVSQATGAIHRQNLSEQGYLRQPGPLRKQERKKGNEHPYRPWRKVPRLSGRLFHGGIGVPPVIEMMLSLARGLGDKAAFASGIGLG